MAYPIGSLLSRLRLVWQVSMSFLFQTLTVGLKVSLCYQNLKDFKFCLSLTTGNICPAMAFVFLEYCTMTTRSYLTWGWTCGYPVR